MNDTTDALIYKGEAVATRHACKDMIEARAKQENITEDAAWEIIQKELIAYLDHQIERRAQKAYGKGVGQGGGRNASGPAARPEEGSSGINGNVLDTLPEDAIPQSIRDQGMSIMEAIASGRFKLEGEHPLANTLRQTILSTEGLAPDAAAEAMRVAKSAMHQVEFDMPGLQYPHFKSSVRVMPSDINRTSLFHVGSNNLPRRACKNERLGRIGDGVNIFYQGEELRQTDEAVFRQLIHVARGLKPWDWIYIRQCSFLKDAKGTSRRLGGKDSKELHEIIMRLRAGLLFIQSKRRGSFITCNLLSDYEGSGNEQRVRLDPRVILLFDSYATLDEAIIYSLSGVAQKMYNYIQTVGHTGLHPILITNLFELCYGRREYLVKEYKKQVAAKSRPDDTKESAQKRAELAISKKFSDFHRKSMPAALDELKEHGLIVAYDINRKEEKVSIVKANRVPAGQGPSGDQ